MTRAAAATSRALALLLVSLCGLLACGERADIETTSPTRPGAEAGEPRRGGTLVLAVQDDARSLDPHAAADAASVRMIENLYSTLLRYDEGLGVYEPDLAESVEESDEGRTVTLRLRDDAVFHSGRPVTSDDARFSIERVREMGIRAAQFAAVDAIETPDERTVVLRLSQPLASLRSYLAQPMNAILDRELVEANGGRIDQIDAGSGPFRLVEWRRDQRLVLRRHDRYHEPGLPYLDGVVIRPIPDETARATAIRTGEVHLVADVSPKDAVVLSRDPAVVLASVPGTFWEYVGMNTRRPPLDDPRVRQAIAHAIDRDQLNRLVKFGRATPLTGGHLPPGHWAHGGFSLYPRRDLGRARALLRDAGHERVALTLKVGSAFPYQVQAASAIKQHLKDAGIDVTLQALESQVFFDMLGGGDFDLNVVGWVGLVDPDEWMYDLFRSDGAYNQQGYRNGEVDRLLTDARYSIDRDRRAELYRAAQRIVAEEAPMAFLYLNDHTSAWRDTVRGYRVHPTATTLGLRETWLVNETEP